MWKEFFYFSKSERRGVLVLICLILVVLLLPTVHSWLWPPAMQVETTEQGLAEYHRFIASLQRNDSLSRIASRAKNTPSRHTKIELHTFDPNTTDSVGFVRLGLKPYVARNILRYRQKGGSFSTPESFSRIYGISPEQFEELHPYILIDKAYQREKRVVSNAPLPTEEQQNTDPAMTPLSQYAQQKYPNGTIVDLNAADTTTLKMIPGIGSRMANGIVGYRSKLGGFYKVEQLQELSYVPDSLNKWFDVSLNTPIHRLNLNRSGLDKLRSHPYLNFYQSKVIVEYRKRKGKLTSLNQLALYEEFKPGDLDRLQPYVCFD